MNLLKSLCLSVLLLTLATAGRPAEPFRTDINPALLYYQTFTLAPDLSAADRQYLFDTDWRARPLDARFEELIARYDNAFKLLRQAARSQVPCDWGVDMSAGPETLLPGLARAKGLAVTARLRARWHLEHNRQAEARDDLLAALALGRNTSKDGVLISALVQIAMEQILANVVAENFFRFTPETLERILAGLDAAPPRGTIAQSMAVEKSSFYGWFIGRLREFQATTGGDETQMMARIRELFERTMAGGGEGSPDPGLAERLIAQCGGNSAGILARFQELGPVYDELTALLGQPFDQYGAASKAFDEKLAEHPNPLAKEFLPAISKARTKEFAVEVKLAMVRAAVGYRLHGNEGFRQVLDPCGKGPFQMERLLVGGVDRGFLLRSALNARGYNEACAFLEKDGPAVAVDGKEAGQPLPKQPAHK